MENLITTLEHLLGDSGFGALTMAFYAGRLVLEPAMQNPTIVVITDRNDLDDQLFGTFSMCKDLLRQTPLQAESHEELFRLLDRPSGGVITGPTVVLVTAGAPFFSLIPNGPWF